MQSSVWRWNNEYHAVVPIVHEVGHAGEVRGTHRPPSFSPTRPMPSHNNASLINAFWRKLDSTSLIRSFADLQSETFSMASALILLHLASASSRRNNLWSPSDSIEANPVFTLMGTRLLVTILA